MKRVLPIHPARHARGRPGGGKSPQPIMVFEQDAGKTIQVPSGSTIHVILDGNPTTGYVWEATSVDASILSHVGNSFTHDSSAIASVGKVTLSFQTTGSGQTVLQLTYHQRFESHQHSSKTFEVTLVVT